ncbi:hypothetical protein ACN2XU_23705 [Primorskyibacter sp. 2E107]|uniref:hypothetical protein n=1 Tax=Primorskyibacter sp. 2E107 TaxID=3403458 RepID=UPI003AF5F321
MSWQTNNPTWKGGYHGHQLPSNATQQQIHDHNQGRAQAEADRQKKMAEAYKPKK